MLNFQWTKRVEKSQLKALYQQSISGLFDEKLLMNIGMILYLRCKDIFAVKRAKDGYARCPSCYQNGIENEITRRQSGESALPDEQLICNHCGISFLWSEFHDSYKKEQLNLGGAMPAFIRYMKEYPAAKDCREQFVVIDRLIHEFHYSMANLPQQPTRSVGPNLIEGKIIDIMSFLNELSSGNEDWQKKTKEWADFWYKERMHENPFR